MPTAFQPPWGAPSSGLEYWPWSRSAGAPGTHPDLATFGTVCILPRPVSSIAKWGQEQNLPQRLCEDENEFIYIQCLEQGLACGKHHINVTLYWRYCYEVSQDTPNTVVKELLFPSFYRCLCEETEVHKNPRVSDSQNWDWKPDLVSLLLPNSSCLSERQDIRKFT